jgi:glycosyltransferase involved in cell wall biosynthesis
MKVCVICTLPQTSVSMGVYADALTGGLRAVRPDWDIVAWVPPARAAYTHLPFPLSSVLKYWERFVGYPKTIARIDADIFHIVEHSEAHIVNWLSKKNKKTVATCHDLINFYYLIDIQDGARYPFLSRFAWKYGVRQLRRCDRIIAISTKTRVDVVNYIGVDQKKIVLVPNGIDENFRQLRSDEKKAFRAEKKWRDETIYILNVGSNAPRKNVITVLKSVLVMRASGASVVFVKVGADFSSAEKAFIADHELEMCVEFAESVSQDSLISYYNCADVLVAPSIAEGFGLTLIEAMACGLPVITANVSAMPEIVGDAAALVDPLDVDAIVKEIMVLRNSDDVRKARIEKGLLHARPFTWVKAAETIARVYEGLVARP